MTRVLLFGTALLAAIAIAGCGGNDAVAGPYDLCGSTADCTTAVDGCSFISTPSTTVGICSNNCASDLDCPLDIRGDYGACLSIEGSPPVCFERCISDLDCPSPLFCTITAGVTETICFPP